MKNKEIELMERRARNFLEISEYLVGKGIYDLAAFNAEQAAQLRLKAALLKVVGDYPKTHSIILLLKELGRVDEERVKKFIEENRGMLHALEDAYLTSRYFLKTFGREDAVELLRVCRGVFRLCEELGV